MIAGSPSPSQYPAKMTMCTPSWRYMFSENSWSALGPCFLNILSRWNLVASDLIEWFLTVTIRTYRTDFYLFTWCTDTGVIVTHTLSSTSLWPIILVDSCAARCCDSELRLTVHYCALWPIVAVTLLFSLHLLFALPYCSLTVYKSGLLGTL